MDTGKFAGVESGEVEVVVEAGGGDDEVMGTDHDSLRCEPRTKSGMGSGFIESELDHRKSRKNLFEEGQSDIPFFSGHCALAPEEDLRCNDARNENLGICRVRDNGIQPEMTFFCRDQNGGIQR